MTTATIISDESRTVEARVDGDRLLISPTDLPAALGWELRPEGLCRGDVCVPVRQPAGLFRGDDLDLAAVAGALGRPAVVDAASGVAAVALDSEARRRAIDGLVAPEFTLADLDGVPRHLSDWSDRKRLLLAFSSW